MVKSLSFVLLGVLAAVASAAPLCSKPESPYQEVFSHSNIRARPYSPAIPANHGSELDEDMRRYIKLDMGITYDAETYLEALKEEVCQGPGEDFRLVDCKVNFLKRGTPRVKIIPTRPVTEAFLCSEETCRLSIDLTVDIETTHSDESGLALRASSNPFRQGITFLGMDEYDFSDGHKSSTFIRREYEMSNGDVGYVAIVHTQIETYVHIFGCKCFASESDQLCRSKCYTREGNHLLYKEKGHHEAVITARGKPVGMVDLIVE
ncbi:hypothetical protein BGZ97_008807 [Linnemannia gamsii]|uniref:Uncharacterized protein n=1 Tax=Linnemannia gamsii TaxID=64522 RepID=A0A9P6QQV2_9FUNG|nr:hypothetical protein BGZ97_008807 [Linnemannia gamsii]